MRTIAARPAPHPGQTLPGILCANALPRRGEAVRVLCDGAVRLAHVSAVDRDGGTYSVQLDGALTPRERQVLRLLAAGLKDREIGAELGIGYDTVRHHACQAYAKLGMRGRGEAGQWAERLGVDNASEL